VCVRCERTYICVRGCQGRSDRNCDLC